MTKGKERKFYRSYLYMKLFFLLELFPCLCISLTVVLQMKGICLPWFIMRSYHIFGFSSFKVILILPACYYPLRT